MRYQLVRIDNGLSNPHTGVVGSFATIQDALQYSWAANKRLGDGQRSGMGRRWHPYALLDTETGRKIDARASRPEELTEDLYYRCPGND